MIYDLDGKPMNREGTRTHWDLYRGALLQRPDLIANLEHAIRSAVTVKLEDSTAINSSWLGSELLSTFARRREWADFVPESGMSSSLFGMILWTVLFDDHREWTFAMTCDRATGDEHRVYLLRPPPASTP